MRKRIKIHILFFLLIVLIHTLKMLRGKDGEICITVLLSQRLTHTIYLFLYISQFCMTALHNL